MLGFTPVTDLVRHTDDPAQAEHIRAVRGRIFRGPHSHLRAAE